jgi:hypothetical protein
MDVGDLDLLGCTLLRSAYMALKTGALGRRVWDVIQSSLFTLAV